MQITCQKMEIVHTIASLLVVAHVLVTVSASQWEVYNDDDLTVEKIFIPVGPTEPQGKSSLPEKSKVNTKSNTESVDKSKQSLSSKNDPITAFTNIASGSGAKTPTLSSAETGHVIQNGRIPRLKDPQVPSAHARVGDHKGNNVVKFSQTGKSESSKNSQNGGHRDSTSSSSERSDITPRGGGKKQIPSLKLIKSPVVIKDFSEDLLDDVNEELYQEIRPQQLQKQQQQQQQQQQHQQPKTATQVEAVVAVGDSVGGSEEDDISAEEIFVEGKCPPDLDDWECLLMQEEFLTMAKDSNLSGQVQTALRRVKRQSDGDLIEGSGDGDTLYPPESTNPVTLTLSNTLTFGNSDLPFDETEFVEDLTSQLTDVLQSLPGFLGVQVGEVTQNPDGTVSSTIIFQVDSGASDYATLTNDQFLDVLNVNLTSLTTAIEQVEIQGREVVNTTSADEMTSQASDELNDPCSTSQCEEGYHLCVALEGRDVQCTHKCETYESNRTCEHGSTCELEAGEPYCACTKGWTGDYCDTSVRDKSLDEGEITGVAVGVGVLLVGLIGAACFAVAFRRNTKDLIFTHYSDEEGSGSFSNPSSKLSNFVIDRPRISIAPVNTFNPSLSFSNNGSGRGRPPRNSSA